LQICFSLRSSISFRFPLFSVSNGRRCDHRAAGLWVLSGLQLSVVGESVDGAAVAGLWALLKLGRPREGRTAADRESKEKRESAGAGALDVADGCGLEAVSLCSVVRGDTGAEGKEKWGTMEVGLRGTMRWGRQPSLLAGFFWFRLGNRKVRGKRWRSVVWGTEWLLRFLFWQRRNGRRHEWGGRLCLGCGRRKWRWAAVEKQVGSGFQRMSGHRGAKGSFQMARGPWLSSSGRAKAKDPGRRRLLGWVGRKS